MIRIITMLYGHIVDACTLGPIRNDCYFYYAVYCIVNKDTQCMCSNC